MKQERGKWLRGVLGAAAGAIVLYFVLRSCDWRQAADAFAQAKLGWVLMALFLVILHFFIKGFRLMILSDGRWHAPMAYTEAVTLGLGVNSFIPLRAGEFLKIAYMVRNAGNSIFQATLSVVVERILDVACMAMLLAVMLGLERELFMLWFEKMRPALESKASLVMLGGVLAVGGCFLVLGLWLFDFRGLRTRFAGKLREMASKIKEIRASGGHRLSIAMILTLLVWSMDSLFLYFMTSAFGLGILFRQIFFLQVVLTASYASSVSPGALGLYEFLGLWALKALGKPEIPSLACLLAAHGLIFAVMGIGALMVLIKGFWISPKVIKET